MRILKGGDQWLVLTYGIPLGARRVAKLNPIDKSITFIGPDFGDSRLKWWTGAITYNGINCPQIVVASSRSIRTLILSHNCISTFQKEKVEMLLGHHVLSLVMDVFTSCHITLTEFWCWIQMTTMHCSVPEKAISCAECTWIMVVCTMGPLLGLMDVRMVFLIRLISFLNVIHREWFL